MRNLIDVQVDREIEADYPQLNGCRLRITLETGEVRQVTLPNMKGEPEFRMSQEEMREKFTVLTRDLFSDDRVDQIDRQCMNLESLAEIGDLLRFCSAKEPVTA